LRPARSGSFSGSSSLEEFHDAGVRLVTVEEGDIDEMTIGFKGTMNAGLKIP
jgi:hypothetical protein